MFNKKYNYFIYHIVSQSYDVLHHIFKFFNYNLLCEDLNYHRLKKLPNKGNFLQKNSLVRLTYFI